MTQNNEGYITVPCYFLLFPHYRCIPLIIAAAKNVLITVCVRRHCQSREANIPDRVHNACHVNEVCISSPHIGRLPSESQQTRRQWVQVLLFPSLCPQAEMENKNHLLMAADLKWNISIESTCIFWGEFIICYYCIRKTKDLSSSPSEISHWNAVYYR